MNRLTLVGAIACKVSHNLSSCNPPRAINRIVIISITSDNFVGWAAHQTVFSVACNSDSKILATLQIQQ